MQQQMRLFEKEIKEMSLDEAKAAYEHLVRNMDWDSIQAVECCPESHAGDGEFVAVRKRVYRRIRALQ